MNAPTPGPVASPTLATVIAQCEAVSNAASDLIGLLDLAYALSSNEKRRHRWSFSTRAAVAPLARITESLFELISLTLKYDFVLDSDFTNGVGNLRDVAEVAIDIDTTLENVLASLQALTEVDKTRAGLIKNFREATEIDQSMADSELARALATVIERLARLHGLAEQTVAQVHALNVAV